MNHRVFALLALATPLALSPLALGQAGKTDSSTMIVIDGGRKVEVKKENGKVVYAAVDGEKVDLRNVTVDGDHVVITDGNGTVVFDSEAGVGERKRLTWGLLPRDGQGRIFVQPGQGEAEGEAPRELRRMAEAALRDAERARQRALNAERAARDAAGPAAEMAPPKTMVGITLEAADDALARHFGLDPKEVSIVSMVSKDLPAAKAGLKPYDLVVAVEGKTPATLSALRAVLREKNAGDKIKVTAIQRGERKELEVTLEAYDAKRLAGAKTDGIVRPEVAWGGEDAEDVFRRFEGFGGGDGQNRIVVTVPGQPGPGGGGAVAPVPPAPPAAPGARFFLPPGERGAEAERFARLEERLAKLEALLEKLAAQKGAENR
jgi:membrane-associated protease RseP (regulator of RpoE activity)